MHNTSIMIIIKDNQRIFLELNEDIRPIPSLFLYLLVFTTKGRTRACYNAFAQVGFRCPDLMPGNSICRILPPTHLGLILNGAARGLLKVRNAYSSIVFICFYSILLYFIQLFESQAQTKLRVHLVAHPSPSIKHAYYSRRFATATARTAS